jgi:histidine phosphatase superfamily protein (branch 1)
LVAHGQHTGFTDIAPTAHGEDEARALGLRFRTTHFSKILTSPLRRAGQTCELAGLGADAEIEPDLVEWNYGDYEGKRTVDIQQGRPGWNIWRDGRPQGETPANVSDRADRIVARLPAPYRATLRFSRTANLAQLSRRDGSDWQSSKLNTSRSVRHRSASWRMRPVAEGPGHCALECDPVNANRALHVLALNSGSSSLKFGLYRVNPILVHRTPLRMRCSPALAARVACIAGFQDDAIRDFPTHKSIISICDGEVCMPFLSDQITDAEDTSVSSEAAMPG